MRRAFTIMALSMFAAAMGQGIWTAPIRGSWVREGKALAGDVSLVWTQIVVRPELGSSVWRAAKFLQADLAKITGTEPTLGSHFRPFTSTRILVEIASDPSSTESYRIRTDRNGIVITGSDNQGAAFGVYELAERVGIDPLYIWTGLTPTRNPRLVVKKIDLRQGPPKVRWRGLFHDDEDVLPRPLQPDGTPDPNGKVSRIWYERLFETALRLKMNMVAPWVRTQRTFEIQKLASDWGLAYTSHHYDILLSDPYHFNRGLAQARGIEPIWDWLQNREGILKFWRAGVQENRGISAIYPIGLRGTNDYSYRFPAEWSQDQKIAAYNDALALQAEIVDQELPPEVPRRLHFTMYTEMLPYYQTGKLSVPKGTIVVWPDDNDGRMRGLPTRGSAGKHGVYFHLAYLGRSLTKQLFSTVPLSRIEQEFRKILASGATEFVLTNVSELREFAMGTRFIADIMWQGDSAFRERDSAGRFLEWWCKEYYGTGEVKPAVSGVMNAFQKPTDVMIGGDKVLGAVASLKKKFARQPFVPADPTTLPTLRSRIVASQSLGKKIHAATWKLNHQSQEQRYFFESVELAAAVDMLNCLAAEALVKAMSEPNLKSAALLCRRAAIHLDQLDAMLRIAERPPFQRWYGETWIAERNRSIVWPRRELAKLIASLPKA